VSRLLVGVEGASVGGWNRARGWAGGPHGWAGGSGDLLHGGHPNAYRHSGIGFLVSFTPYAISHMGFAHHC